ncbi:unnamed protein product [Chrysodeixis includens]|uniref:Uncharacterized protein n=1 Tax=Chrysodeixis includens TaxID=689277 RepID=A0A9N8KPB3_CHRIL|nr:unnamed protein product [Chrysodeixis includens]
MFMHHSETAGGQPEQEFSRPVESIMRCEDFKSNFARRLSNRYSSRAPAAGKRQSSLKLRSPGTETVDTAPEKNEHCSQLSKIIRTEQNGDVVKLPEKQTKNHNVRDTEVSALNMAIETLRWQLAQTEANRQMHIALLKQVVTFLSRVKEHIACQSSAASVATESVATREVSPSAHADLPRSRSVLHVNKHEYSLTSGKKMSTRKISKSISNVNGFKDCNGVWNQSKLSLTLDTDGTQKITEEISRLITLANTVLSTKIPDLACKCNDSNDTLKDENISETGTLEHNESNTSLNLIGEDATNAFILNTIYDSEGAFNGLASKYPEGKDGCLTDFIVSSSPLSCDLENEFAAVNINQKDESIKIETESKTRVMEKRNGYNHVAHFIEDESGFSSMSSFQEIGIPIISIIPPSPCKEVGYIEEFADLLDEADQWKAEPLDLDKQTVKVFWV